MTESDSGSMRASDADREAIAQRLRAGLDEGRLSIVEYDERLRQAYASTTFSQLEPLVADLPEPVPAKPSAETVKRERDKRKVVKEWRDWASVTFILVAIWGVTSIASGGPLFFWPMFPMGIWAAVNLASMISGGGGHKKCKESDSDH
ncbi:DUF1707 SHOCT-like domain-containing protein [Saccharopolyspora phatthalungensis]|uniref:DUF1707 domain-containing protein n=1 Tax=Saccharopolyspora phatthalungensis TaxID=664693 RepID=A0A840Q209_9PSEU|nr:DUF1707 domain-containing protein [Saccharopolyspora phatthalungensis]MBB5154454.1 hypothetical protein [Saccharopolyspora phatthalungensis]